VKLRYLTRKIPAGKAFPLLTVAASTVALLLFPVRSRSADPRIDYILKTNLNKVDVHFGTEPNRTYFLQAINVLPCPSCPPGGTATNIWTNLLTVVSAPFPPSNHYIFRDGTTNRSRFYRLRVTP
jgi:hypothetical protein